MRSVPRLYGEFCMCLAVTSSFMESFVEEDGQSQTHNVVFFILVIFGQVHPEYRRRSPEDGGRSAVNRRHQTVDNRWVVPYCPYLMLKYESHINVELCTTVDVIKYLFKYVYKGGDRAMAAEVPAESNAAGEANTEPRNEITEFLDRKSTGTSEAMWRMYGFPMFRTFPAVFRLKVHLPEDQRVFIIEGQEDAILNNQAARDRLEKTTLTEFFTFNRENEDAITPYYCFPTEYTYSETNRRWTKRKGRLDTIGRMYAIHPNQGELYYLRTLLNNDHSAGKTSFDDLRTVDGELHDAYRDACAALGLLQDDSQWRETMIEATAYQMPTQLRELFFYIIQNNEVSDPLSLFEDNVERMGDDFVYKYSREGDVLEANLARTMVLMELADLFRQVNRQLSQFNLPTPTEAEVAAVNNRKEMFNERDLSGLPAERRAQLEYIVADLRREVAVRMNGDADGKGKYTPSQRHAHDAIMAAAQDPVPGPRVFCIQARGGCGKSYLQVGILSALRVLEDDAIALSVATTGLAATLLGKMGSTFHSTFKAPLDATKDMNFNVSPDTAIGRVIRDAKGIVIDEVTSLNRFLFEALDRLLRDLMQQPNIPFGGKLIIISGDWQQGLPVIPGGSRAQIINATLTRSTLWAHVQILELKENMRVDRHLDSDPARAEELAAWDEYLTKVGTGQLEQVAGGGYVKLPHANCIDLQDPIIGKEQLIEKVFGDLAVTNSNYEQTSKRAILAGTNADVDDINERCLAKLDEDPAIVYSADSTVDKDIQHRFQTDYLNTLNASGIPPHKLHLKENCIVMLTRNLNKIRGLCNGTKLLVLEIKQRLLRCKILGGDHGGREVLIPRILLRPQDTRQPCEWQRLQFPLKVAYAMTISKSQGQSLDRAGIYLWSPVFTHGQLYVASSRTGSPDSTIYAVRSPDGMDPFITKNIVFREILSDAMDVE